jgi:hypothetical protein
VHGHFERGGDTRWSEQSMVIDRVLVYRKLVPVGKPEGSAEYKIIAASPSATERFAMNVITTHPDVDHIVAEIVPPNAPWVDTLTLDRDQGISAASASVAHAFAKACACQLKKTTEIYRETGDLE